MAKHPIQLELAEGRVEAFIELPDGLHRIVDLASQVLGLSSVAAEMGERAVERQGAKVSCTKGCGACCRQLVPISPPEAAMMYEFVASMPQPARTIIENRFAKAVTHLEGTGLLQRLEDPENPLLYKAEEDYFLQQIPLSVSCKRVVWRLRTQALALQGVFGLYPPGKTVSILTRTR